MKKGQLYDWHREIQEWKRINSIKTVFLKAQIDAFYKLYGEQIDKLIAEIRTLDREWYEFDGDVPKVSEAKQLILRSGKTAQEANAAFMALMNEEIPVKSNLIVMADPKIIH